MSSNHCDTCQNMTLKDPNKDPNAHCYMFKEEPRHLCMQHSDFRRRNAVINSQVVYPNERKDHG